MQNEMQYFSNRLSLVIKLFKLTIFEGVVRHIESW